MIKNIKQVISQTQKPHEERDTVDGQITFVRDKSCSIAAQDNDLTTEVQ